MAVDEYLCFMFSGGLAVFVRAVLLLLQGIESLYSGWRAEK